TGMFRGSGANPLDFVRWHTQAKLTVPSALVDGVPTALDEIVVRLLAREARRRIGHADDLAKMLAALVADLTRGAPDRAPSGAPCAPAPGAEEPPAEIAASAYLYRPQLAGRDGVLEAFGERIALALQRAGSAVIVGGESGVGKTYLVTAVARDAALRHLAVVTGECQPVATAEAAGSDVRGAPLHPFRRLLQAIADRCREGGRGAADRILGPRGKILAAYEPTLRHLPGQDAYPDPPDVPAQAARRRILAALGGALAALAEERPLLFVIDDLQWADELSLDFLRSLDDSYFAGRPLLLVGTYRIEEVGDALREVLSAPARARVELGRLDERTVGAIIGDMLAMDCPPEPLVRALARRSGGNPFFVAEYLRAAVAERLLHREHGAWRFAEGEAGACDELPLPGSLRELVARRLDGLDPDARALVEAAAVLGREVDGDLLVAVAGMPQPAALPALKELLSRQVLEEVKDGTFRFVHDKLREIAYDRIPVPRRRALHLDGARALEARHRGAVSFSLLYSELAYHFTEASELAEAIDYLDMAGLQAERSFANREAARAFAEALALDARNVRRVPPFRRAVWERRLGNAYLGLGKLVESQEALLRAVALLGHPVPVPTWRLVPAFLGQVAIQAAHRAREPEWRARPPSRREVLLEAARAYDLLVQASYYVTGDILRILHATLSNLNLAERAGPSPELALAYGNAHFTAGLIPCFSLARTYARRAHEILEGVTDPAIRSWVYVLAGAYATGVGDFDQAISLGQRAEAIAEEVGFRRRAEEALGVCGATYNLAGDFIQGRDTSHRIYESSLRGDPQTQVWGLSGVAMNCVALGEIDRAVDAAARSEKCLSQKLGRPEKIFCYGVLALTRLRAGDPEGALAAAESGAAAIAEGTPISFYAITAYSYVADVLLDLWERAGSLEPRRALERKARRSCDDVVASARIFPVHRPHAFLVRGRCAALTGDLPAARRLWQKSIASARELRMPYDEALAELALALSLPPTSPDRRPRLHRAAALFRQKSAAPDLARAEAALLG
ncbi:MAG: AAA family ATPase, partial [Polyangiaceae bacterium]|nr:AAA family ATPase [Polyangiaceae bacterium]